MSRAEMGSTMPCLLLDEEHDQIPAGGDLCHRGVYILATHATVVHPAEDRVGPKRFFHLCHRHGVNHRHILRIRTVL